MFAGTVDAGEGFFTEQADKVMLLGDPLHDLHGQLVLVVGEVGIRKEGRHFVLGRRHFIVLRFGADPELPEFIV